MTLKTIGFQLIITPFLMEDQNIRKEIKKRLKNSSISKMQIKRKGSDRVLVDIHSAKPA